MLSNERISKVIFEYAAKIGGATEPDALLWLNADLARDLIGADRCSIWLVDAKHHELWTRVAHGVKELRLPMGKGLVGACVDRNEMILVNDTSLDDRFFKGMDAQGGYVTKSILTLPLRDSSGKAMGALQVLNKPDGFSQEDVDILGLASAYAASALETQRLRREAAMAEVMMKELEIARDVQQRMFPQHPPPIPGLDYAGYCRPAKFVGGDYYDFLPMPGGCLLFTLGDVSGKGIGAAVLMAWIQASVRSYAVRIPDSLLTLMTELNKEVYWFSTEDKYSTLFCGLLDTRSRKLSFVNGGQVRPILLRARDGSLERLDTDGFPVGLMELSRYGQGEVTLEPGDSILAFSDGISEAVNNSEEMWDEPQVVDVLRSCIGLGAKQTIEQLIAEVDRFAGDAEQADDMTVVAMKVT